MEEERNKNMFIAQHYKMRFYENEFPFEGELVMVNVYPLRDNLKNHKKMDAMFP